MTLIYIIIGSISLILDMSLKKKFKAIDEAVKLLPKGSAIPKNPLKTIYAINSVVMYVIVGLLVYTQFFV